MRIFSILLFVLLATVVAAPAEAQNINLGLGSDNDPVYGTLGGASSDIIPLTWRGIPRDYRGQGGFFADLSAELGVGWRELSPTPDITKRNARWTWDSFEGSAQGGFRLGLDSKTRVDIGGFVSFRHFPLTAAETPLDEATGWTSLVGVRGVVHWKGGYLGGGFEHRSWATNQEVEISERSFAGNFNPSVFFGFTTKDLHLDVRLSYFETRVDVTWAVDLESKGSSLKGARSRQADEAFFMRASFITEGFYPLMKRRVEVSKDTTALRYDLGRWDARLALGWTNGQLELFGWVGFGATELDSVTVDGATPPDPADAFIRVSLGVAFRIRLP